MHCLVTIIGNRNITYRENVYSRDNDRVSFLEWSYDLLERYNDIKGVLDINIFVPLVTDANHRPDKIVILYSDQREYNTRTDQDTIYEAGIIKRILVEKYNYVSDQVELYHTPSIVIDNGGLMKAYRQFLIGLKKRKFAKVTICDAGGTAQQKMSLKVMAEFILHKDEYEVKYALDNKIITDVNVDEYRNVINTEQAMQLIEVGHFEAAATLLDYSINPNDITDYKHRVFMCAMHWFNGDRKSAKMILEPIRTKIRAQMLVDLDNNIVYSNNQELADFFGSRFPSIVDRFYKVMFLISVKRYSEAVLSFSHFYEKFLEVVIEYYSAEFEVGTRDYESPDQKLALQALIEKWYPSLVDHQASSRSIGSQIMLGKKMDKSNIVSFCTLMSPYVDYTDDTIAARRITNLRNKIAHEGLFVSELDFNLKYQYVQSLIQSIGNLLHLTKANQYSEVVQLIQQNLRS